MSDTPKAIAKLRVRNIFWLRYELRAQTRTVRELLGVQLVNTVRPHPFQNRTCFSLRFVNHRKESFRATAAGPQFMHLRKAQQRNKKKPSGFLRPASFVMLAFGSGARPAYGQNQIGPTTTHPRVRQFQGRL